jgi:uncharacterized membrane protein (UPF0127 family)
MIWTDADGRFCFSADTPPCKADPCPSYGPETPASQVLEIAGSGGVKAIIVGSILKFQDIK